MIYDIHEYREDEIAALKSLWREVFGDGARVTDSFFELLPSMGTGFAAVRDGEVFGGAYVLDAFLHLSDGSTKKAAYIYAVAVDDAARGSGIGAELTRACMRYAWECGADVCCTLPAEEALYDWYKTRCGFENASFCSYETVPAGENDGSITRLHADEYAFLREDMLRGRPHIGFYYGYLSFQETIFDEYGGGFFACNGGIACGYVEDGVLQVKEALGCGNDFIAALCTMLGAEKAVVRKASDCGEQYVAAYLKAEYPPDTVWDLTLD